MLLPIFIFILIRQIDCIYENTLIIELGNSSSSSSPASNKNGLRSPVRDDTGSHLISRIQEVKELVLKMDQVFNGRLDKLNERITRLESNQKNVQYMMAASDWRPLTSTGKKVRVFTAESTYSEAKEICKAHQGKLLLIDSEIENRRVTDYLQNYEQNLYWIGVQATISFAIPVGKYHNFDGQEDTNCATLTTTGKWATNDCRERHGFVCQFNYV